MQNIRVDLGASARCIWLYMTPLVYESKGDSDQYVQLIWTYEPAHAMWYMWHVVYVAQTSIRKRAFSPEPSLLAHAK